MWECGNASINNNNRDVLRPVYSCTQGVWVCGALGRPVASRRSWKNFWLKMNATPLISSTLASADVFLLMKFAVMAMASLPRNSLRWNPGRPGGRKEGSREDDFNVGIQEVKVIQLLNL